jgi:hypothetical protein
MKKFRHQAFAKTAGENYDFTAIMERFSVKNSGKCNLAQFFAFLANIGALTRENV